MGKTFPGWARAAIARRSGVSWIVGAEPRLTLAATAAVGAGILAGRTGFLLRLQDLVGERFGADRAALHAAENARVEAEVVALIAGPETPHRWNGPILCGFLARREAAARHTILATTTPDLGDLYGDHGVRVSRAHVSRATFDLGGWE